MAAGSDLDVVDAHWMALTMWGEARGDGEAGMRAVGHVIDNRRRSGRNPTTYVTDTVSEAWQFSCWNPGDPNLAAMLNVEALPANSHERLMWQAARRLAEEILSGRSEDPTGGALFYHSVDVAPRWSRGIAPAGASAGTCSSHRRDKAPEGPSVPSGPLPYCRASRSRSLLGNRARLRARLSQPAGQEATDPVQHAPPGLAVAEVVLETGKTTSSLWRPASRSARSICREWIRRR